MAVGDINVTVRGGAQLCSTLPIVVSKFAFRLIVDTVVIQLATTTGLPLLWAYGDSSPLVSQMQ